MPISSKRAAGTQTMRLPIRFLPDYWDSLGLAVGVGVLGFIGFILYSVWRGNWSPDMDPQLVRLGTFLIPVGALVLLAGVLRVLLLPILLSRAPGGPYYYTEIAQDGIAVRAAWRVRRFKWTALASFAAYKDFRFGARITYHWVLLLADPNRKISDDPEALRRHAAAKILAVDFGGNNSARSAHALAAWFERLRAEAMAHSGMLPEDIPVPPPYCEATVPVPQTRGGDAVGKS